MRWPPAARRGPLRRPSRSLAALGYRSFRLLWVGQTVSAFGDGVVLVGVPFAVLRAGGTAIDIGYVAAIGTVARLVFAVIGGVWADRLRRQLVMLTSDLIRAFIQAILGLLLISGRAEIWELAIGAGLYGVAASFFGPASAGLVPETLPAEELQPGNALMGLSRSLARIVSPAVAGLLVAAVSAGAIYLIDAGTFVVSAVSLGLLVLPKRRLPPARPFLQDLAAGWYELRIRRWYWLNMLSHACWNFGIASFFILGPVIATRDLGGASAWGVAIAAWAAGGLAGGMLALRTRPRRPLVVANLSLLLGALPPLALVAPLPVPALALAAAAGGTGLVFLNGIWAATMQQLIPDEVRSRVDSFDFLVSLVAAPAGYIVFGPLADLIGFGQTLVLAAVLLSVPSLLIVLVPGIRAVRRQDDGLVVGPATSVST